MDYAGSFLVQQTTSASQGGADVELRGKRKCVRTQDPFLISLLHKKICIHTILEKTSTSPLNAMQRDKFEGVGGWFCLNSNQNGHSVVGLKKFCPRTRVQDKVKLTFCQPKTNVHKGTQCGIEACMHICT